MQNFTVQQRSDLIKYFMSHLLSEKWTSQVMTETMCYVIIPMLKDAEKNQDMQELLPDELLDLVFETICKQQSAAKIRQYLSCVRSGLSFFLGGFRGEIGAFSGGASTC